MERIIPRKHGGDDHIDNLALACIDCNLAKGSNLAGIDPETSEVAVLFHPRREVWEEHFAWHGSILIGKTATGRATIAVMRINSEEQLQLRSALRSQ